MRGLGCVAIAGSLLLGSAHAETDSMVYIQGETADGKSTTYVGLHIGRAMEVIRYVFRDRVYAYETTYVERMDYGVEPGQQYAAVGEGVQEPRVIVYDEVVERELTSTEKAAELTEGHFARHGAKYLAAILGAGAGYYLSDEFGDRDSGSGDTHVNGNGNCVGDCAGGSAGDDRATQSPSSFDSDFIRGN